MRLPRLKPPPDHPFAYYHCISRVVDRDFKFGPADKDRFVALMEEYAQFCGVRIVTYCIMCNHFHILVEVPKPPENLTGHDWLFERLDVLTVSYPIAGSVRQQISKFIEQDAQDLVQKVVEKYKALMWNLSAFMKLLKQRFSRLFNRKHDRKGTLWESRFQGTLVEGAGNALLAVAAYIDLNPVRAGMVTDPSEYRWSGYSKACRGDAKAVESVRFVVATAQNVEKEKVTAEVAMLEYRKYLIGKSAMDPVNADTGGVDTPSATTNQSQDDASRVPSQPSPGRVPLGPTKSEILEKVLEKKRVSLSEFVQIRVRCFTDGVVLGSKKFVEEIFQHHREKFGPKRKQGGTRVRGLDKDENLYTLRNLQKRPFG